MNSRRRIRRTESSRTPCKGPAPWNVWAFMTLLCISVHAIAQEAPGYVSQGYTDQVINRTERFFGLNPGSKNLAQEVAFFSDDIDVRHIAFSPDGKYLAVTSMDDLSTHGQEVHIWDWRQEKLIRALYIPQGSHGDPLATEVLKWSPDGRFLATGLGRSGNAVVIRVWNVSDWSVAQDITDPGYGDCSSIAFSPDSQFLIRAVNRGDHGIGDDHALVYDTHTWQKVDGFKLVPYFYPSVMSLSSSGRLMAVAGQVIAGQVIAGQVIVGPHDGNTILVYDIKKGTLLKNIRVEPFMIDKVSNFPPYSVAVSPDERYVMAGVGAVAQPSPSNPYYKFPALSIYSMATGQEVAAIHEHDSARVESIRFLRHGRYLVASEVDGYIQFWKFPEMRLVQEVRGEASSLAVSPDGQYLAGGGYKKIIVWKIH